MPHSSRPALDGIDRNALLRVIEPVVHAHGAELVDIEFRPERAGWVLRLFVEKLGAAERGLSTRDAAVNLELCAGISRDLSPALDVADIVPHAYHLEVSSPGVERPLRSARDFERFKGQKAKLKVGRSAAATDAGDAKRARVYVGVLDGIQDGKVRLLEGARVHEVLLSDIESARLVFEFGTPAAQPRRTQ